MKKIAWVLAAAILLAAGYPLAANIDVRIGVQNAYAELWSKTGGVDYVIIGDSISKAGDPWFFRLAANPLSVINLARSGYTTEQLTPIVEQASALKPKIILYMSGTNDVVLGNDLRGNTVPAYRRNLDIALASGAKVVVTLAPPTASVDQNVRLMALNADIRTLAEEKRLMIIDLWPALIGNSGTIQPRFTPDGIHLSKTAYAIWSDKLHLAF